MPLSYALFPRSRNIWPWLALLGGILALMVSPAGSTELRRTPIVKAVQAARPSVVNIHGHKTIAAADDGAAAGEGGRRVNGMGTGIVVDERGFILTNYHVVDGVKTILVTLHDKRTFTARLVGNDPITDLAIIKIPLEEKLPVISIGTSHDLLQGETVMALGNAYGYEHSLTSGIVSALHRSVQVSDTQKYNDLIQTDAPINPGNSGGPLINIDGQMVGINVAVRVGASNIGFAIPVDEAMAIVAKILSAERLANVWHGVIGESTFVQDTPCFVVKAIEKDSPADKGGLKPGDVIQTADLLRVSRASDFERAFLDRRSGEEVEVAVAREGRPLKVSLTLQASPGGRSLDSDGSWETLGLKLTMVPAGEFKSYGSRYRGGLRVTAVRTESPAAKQGIRAGDVLVGMHKWETITLDNVGYILKHPDLRKTDEPIVFYILRGEETLYGHLSLQPRDRR